MSASAATPATPAGCDDTVPGYQGTLDGEGGVWSSSAMPSVPLPSLENLPAQPERNITSITEEDAREAFISYASSKCCYRSAPAQEGIITKLERFDTHRYRLETFTEKRSTEWCHEPYTGQPVDSLIQPAPKAWEIEAKAPGFFEDEKKTIRVPHTSSVKICHSCNGRGTKTCNNCNGSGNEKCRTCNGSGSCDGTVCSDCNGSGENTCGRCNGKGAYQCILCQGKKQLLVFMTLKIQWTTYKKDFVVEQSSGLKSKKFNKVSGKVMFTDSQCMVDPVANFPDASLCQASDRLIQKHQFKYSHILQQRHTIELIPVTKVIYTWKGKFHSYIVFGNENRVSTKSYPAACCCSVM